MQIAAKREDVELELVDLRDFPLPFFDEPKSPFREPSKNEIALSTKSQKQRKYRIRVGREAGIASGIVSPGALVIGEPSKAGRGT